ncbi:MAG: transcription factor S [Thermoplasmata archaeon]|nr:MAG: transcription factor S [Thermoplasmata archaeon]
MICPRCKLLMRIEGDHYVCKKCGYRKKRGSGEGRKVSIKRVEREIPVIEKDIETLPKTEAVCPECGNTEAYWILRQTRASDEPETRIYICTKCGYRWREY